MEMSLNGRYYELTEGIGMHFWQGHSKFYFGFTNANDANMFATRWQTQVQEGKIVDGKYVVE